MNEREASKQGLVFTGNYSHSKEEMKRIAKQIRDMGFRAVVCDVPPSKYSRGSHGLGYSIYVDRAYEEAKIRYDEWERAQASLDYLAAEIEKKKAELKDLESKLESSRALAATPQPLNVRVR